MRVLSLYIHVPFCTRRCPYCSFFHVACNPDLERAYLEALEEEITLAALELGPVRYRTIFIGGGTPSVLGGEALSRLFDAVAPFTDPSVTVEVTCELNPEDVDDAVLAVLAERGVDRISLGVQSMDAAAQRRLGRCSPRTNLRAIERVRARFSNVSFDVLLGVPGGSPGHVAATLGSLSNFDPTHFSVYCLEPGGDVGGEVEAFLASVDPEASADEYLLACGFLRERGYRHYEVSNFALPGFESAHNRVYWDGSEYVGVGPAAHSYVAGRRYQNAASLSDYLAHRGSRRAGARVYDEGGADTELERVMLALRTAEGMPLSQVRCGAETVSELAAAGLVGTTGGALTLTDRGFLLMNDVVLRILGKDREADTTC